MIDRIEISACTSMMVGKKASLDGATYISRNEDRLVAIYPKRFVVQPAVTGRKETYVSPYNNLTVPLPESGYRYTSTPDADQSAGPNEEDGFNEKNVGESATERVYANERVLAYDPFIKNGLAEDSMTTLVLPFGISANWSKSTVQLKAMVSNLTIKTKFCIWKLSPVINGLRFAFLTIVTQLLPTKSRFRTLISMIRTTICGQMAFKISSKITT